MKCVQHLSFSDALHVSSYFSHSSLPVTLLHTLFFPFPSYVAQYYWLLAVNWIHSQPLQFKQQNICNQCVYIFNSSNPFYHVFSSVTFISVVCQIAKWSTILRTVYFHGTLIFCKPHIIKNPIQPHIVNTRRNTWNDIQTDTKANSTTHPKFGGEITARGL